VPTSFASITSLHHHFLFHPALDLHQVNHPQHPRRPIHLYPTKNRPTVSASIQRVTISIAHIHPALPPNLPSSSTPRRPHPFDQPAHTVRVNCNVLALHLLIPFLHWQNTKQLTLIIHAAPSTHIPNEKPALIIVHVNTMCHQHCTGFPQPNPITIQAAPATIIRKTGPHCACWFTFCTIIAHPIIIHAAPFTFQQKTGPHHHHPRRAVIFQSENSPTSRATIQRFAPSLHIPSSFSKQKGKHLHHHQRLAVHYQTVKTAHIVRVSPSLHIPSCFHNKKQNTIIIHAAPSTSKRKIGPYCPRHYNIAPSLHIRALFPCPRYRHPIRLLLIVFLVLLIVTNTSLSFTRLDRVTTIWMYKQLYSPGWWAWTAWVTKKGLCELTLVAFYFCQFQQHLNLVVWLVAFQLLSRSNRVVTLCHSLGPLLTWIGLLPFGYIQI